jgi:hypothetical protein
MKYSNANKHLPAFETQKAREMTVFLEQKETEKLWAANKRIHDN